MPENNMLAKKRSGDIKDLIQGMESQFGLVVPKCLTPERMVRVALSALSRSPKLKDCSKESLLGSLMTCAELGIEPDGRRAHLIPYGKECQLIIDYKGLVELVRRSGQVQDVRAEIVCDEDHFTWNNGNVSHSIDFKKPRGEMYAAYSYVLFKDGAESFEVMTKDEIEAIRNRSRAGGNGPWKTDFNEMAKKTVFRRHSKWLPLSAEFRDALEKDVDTPADIEVSRPIYDDKRQHAAEIDLSVAEVPAASEVVEEEKAEVVEKPKPKAKKQAKPDLRPEPEEEVVAEKPEVKPATDGGLTPIDELAKSACIAEINTHEGTAYHAGIIAENISAGLDMKDCGITQLRGIVTELRFEASK